MERLFKDATKYTPEIDFDSDSGKLLIKGKSYPENCNEFFEDVIEWIENYFEAPKRNGFHLRYPLL